MISAHFEGRRRIPESDARRYAPGGVLARRDGWEKTCGVGAWELDNEPESYRAHWKGQARDYAEYTYNVAPMEAGDDGTNPKK